MTLADALEAHEEALVLGGRAGVLGLGLVQGALARPYDGYHRRLHKKVAALLHGMATSHGFTDGNKRTALLLTHMLIDRSGYELAIDDPDVVNEEIENLILGTVTGEVTEPEIEDWFRVRLRCAIA